MTATAKAGPLHRPTTEDFHRRAATQPRQGWLDLCGDARIGGVLRHKLPVKADLLAALGKYPGERVTIQLTERLG